MDLMLRSCGYENLLSFYNRRHATPDKPPAYAQRVAEK